MAGEAAVVMVVVVVVVVVVLVVVAVVVASSDQAFQALRRDRGGPSLEGPRGRGCCCPPSIFGGMGSSESAAWQPETQAALAKGAPSSQPRGVPDGTEKTHCSRGGKLALSLYRFHG